MAIEIDNKIDKQFERGFQNIVGDSLRQPVTMFLGNPAVEDGENPLFANDEKTRVWICDSPNDANTIASIPVPNIPKSKLVFGAAIIVKNSVNGYKFEGLDTEYDSHFSEDDAQQISQQPIVLTQILYGTIQPAGAMSVTVKSAFYGNDFISDIVTGDITTLLDTSSSPITIPTTNNRTKGVLVQLDAVAKTLSFKQSSEYISNISLEQQYVAGNLPLPDSDKNRIGYIQLYKGQFEIVYGDIFQAPTWVDKFALGLDADFGSSQTLYNGDTLDLRGDSLTVETELIGAGILETRLVPSGVTPASHFSPDLTVDTYGRITIASAGKNSSTGVTDWDSPFLAINANPAKVDVSAGIGRIVDYHSAPPAVTEMPITWNAQLVTITAVATNDITYLLINSSGTVIQQLTYPTAEERRENIFIGGCQHTSGAVVAVGIAPDIIVAPANQLHELIDAFGIINISTRVTNNGATLQLSLIGGELMARGRGYSTDKASPNVVTVASSTPKSFAYITQVAGSAGSTISSVIPGSYDSAGTITAISGSNNRATNQRIYLFPSGLMRIAYGQVVYDNIAQAIQNLGTETFTVNPNISEVGAPSTGVLIAVLVIRKGAADLSDPNDARILPVSRFGDVAVGGSGGSTTTIQQAYTNSTDGQILTDATRDGVKIRGGTGTNTDKSLKFINNAGTDTLTVDANGLVMGATISHSANTLLIGTGVIKTLASDIAAAGTDRHLIIAAQSGVTDDLIEITGLSIGERVWLRADAGDTISVKHNDAGAANKIYLRGLAPINLSEQSPLELVQVATNVLAQPL